jgi:hypothetical protein
MPLRNNRKIARRLLGRRQACRQLCHVTLQGKAKAAKNSERHVAFATLNSAIIGTINIRCQGKRFLRQANAFALGSDPSAQFVKDSLLVHRAG